MMKLISKELESLTGKDYPEILSDIWEHYETNMLEKFPYIGGDKVSGTSNLTGAFCYVSMGEVLKEYGVDTKDAGHLMVLSYERMMNKIPGFAKKLMRKLFNNTKLVNKTLLKKDAKNAANAKVNPGSFVTKTQIPPEEGYKISYHNLTCPLASFAKQNGYGEYMPYLCNLDYVMFGVMGLPLQREHTCFDDGDYCDFKTDLVSDPMPYWPPVSMQGKGYK
ncbi:MAG: L-2-amino-thiazoline-4-carboxylic acid hydrolase [Saccharofermentans sp.]|nr:L-2-amino-thiazoline-4-carboxylic acid hydrolase [Saccharofermentans sp.]